MSLVQEEMRRVLLFLQKRAAWWVDTSGIYTQYMATTSTNGVQAYAMKQADTLTNLGLNFACEWRQVRQDCGMGLAANWPSQFLQVTSVDRQIRRRHQRRKLRHCGGAVVLATVPDPSCQ